MPTITVSAICFERADGAVLTVQKRGTDRWMLPGGKPEAGESAIECAIREVHEELEIAIDRDALEPMGVFETIAANEAGYALTATVFRTTIHVDPRPRAEIAHSRWILPDRGIADPAEAPLNREHVFPLLLGRRTDQP